MALMSAAALVHRLGATALQLKAVYVQHFYSIDDSQNELGYLLSGLRELSVVVHAALLEGFQTDNETLSRAVCSTLERVLHALEELRNHEYRCLASARGSPSSATAVAAASHSSSFGQCSSHPRNCHAQLGQAAQELQSYVHLSVSMASCALASGGQAYRSLLPLPEQITSKLSELHSMASTLEPTAAAAAADSHAVSKAVRRLARLVIGCPTEQMAALVKLAHMANKSSSSCYAIAAAGGIPLVVDLLGSSNMDVLDLAAGMLGTMAYASPALQAAVGAAGGVERLAKLLGGGHPAVQRFAAKGRTHHGGAAVESDAEQAAMQQLEACFAGCHC